MKTLKQFTITAVMLAFTIAATKGYYPLPPPPPPNDNFLYADNHPDYVLQNASTHQTAIWYLNNNAYLGSEYGPTLWFGWSLEGVVALYGDSQVGYYLVNPVTQQTTNLSWSSSTCCFGAGSGSGPTVPKGWKLVATADSDWDGQPDYVLLNATTHQTAIWYMIGDFYIRGVFGPTLPSGWVLVGVTDFNRDWQRDYVLFNPTTRQTAIWYLSGVTFLRGVHGPTVPNGMKLVATADFNGDGKPDYLLYKPATRQTAIWYLNNNVYTGTAYGPTLPAGWNLVTVTHLNND